MDDNKDNNSELEQNTGERANEGDEDMLADTIEKKRLADFISKNKAKLYETARNNTTYNSEGKATISVKDEWCKEDWDSEYERGNSK